MPQCGSPLQIPGPHTDLPCDHCCETSTADASYWDIIQSALEHSSESPGEPAGWSQNFRTDIDCMITAPKCPGCKGLLPAASVPTGTDADKSGTVERVDTSIKPITFMCPDCGSDLKITTEEDRVITCRSCDSDWYLLRAILEDDKRERLLLGKLEVLIAEKRGDDALTLLGSIKVRD